MDAKVIIIACEIIISVLMIVSVLLQPAQKSGLIGDATDIETREKRGAELFLYRTTIILGILFIFLAILYGAANSGMIF